MPTWLRDLTGVEEIDPEQGARKLWEWLAARSARWLVVLDDVQSPQDLRGLWPPHSPDGQVLVTTRRRDAALRGHHRQLIEIDVFTEPDAHAYLRAALAGHSHLRHGAAGLTELLGCLPLALAQAAAYMIDRNLSCAAYQQRWINRRRSLAGMLPDAEGLPDGHQATMATTWSISVEHANHLEPAGLAGTLLELASFLDPNGMPVEVFSAPAVTRFLTERVGWMCRGNRRGTGWGVCTA